MSAPRPHRAPLSFGPGLLIALSTVWLAGLVVLPLANIAAGALSQGPQAYLQALANPDTVDAFKLTLMVCGLSVPLNAIFGLAVAWTVTRFNFPGRSLMLSIVDMPLTLSPVISGLVWILLFSIHGWFGPWLSEHHVKIIFALPGLVLATSLVTLPLVARELIPLMQEQGMDEEVAAVTLGASGWDVFWRITLPNIRWALLYGVLLSTARAMGEFGAVSVVSGHIAGQTNTLPLHIEALYNNYDSVGAFASASILVALALITLMVRSWLEQRFAHALSQRPQV